MSETEGNHDAYECVGIQTGNICESHLLLDILAEWNELDQINQRHIKRHLFLTFKQGIAFATMLAIVSAWRETNHLAPLNYDARVLAEQSRETLLGLATEMIANLKEMGAASRPGKMQ